MTTPVLDRSGYIGGSDIGAILGVDRFRTILDVWREKVGEAPPFAGNPDTERGMRLEAVAAEEYTKRTGIKLRRDNQPLVHPQHDFLRGRVDRRAIGGDIREIKCPRFGAFLRTKREGLSPTYIAQMQWYVGLDDIVRGRSSGNGEWIIFCADAWDLLPVPVSVDGALFAGMVERAVHFWNEHVVTRVAPTLAQVDELKMQVEAVGGDAIRRDDAEFAEAIGLLEEAKRLTDEAETIEKNAKARVLELIGNTPGLYLGAGCRLSLSMSKGKTSFDKKALAASKPLDMAATLAALTDLYVSRGALPAAAIEFAQATLLPCLLDLSKFETTGKPYQILRSTFYHED